MGKSDALSDALVEEILMHCLFAIGRGAQMDIERKALARWRQAVEAATTKFIYDDPSPQQGDTSKPGEPRWDRWKDPILRLCEALGKLAARNALDDGKSVIQREHLRSAFNTLKDKGGCPISKRELKLGFFCGDWR